MPLRVKTFRPAVLPDNRNVVLYPVIVASIVVVAGLLIGNPVMVVLPLIILAVFPGLPVLFHAIYCAFVKVEMGDDGVVITDYLGDKVVQAPRRAEIRFDEIDYVFYLEREINILLSLLDALQAHHVSSAETDFTRENLVRKYRIPEDVIDDFENDSLKGLTDYAAAGIGLKLDEICRRHKVSKKTGKMLRKALQDEATLDFEYIRNALSSYPIGAGEWDDLKDAFEEIGPDIVSPFLRTRLDLKKYKQLDANPRTATFLARKNNALVLADKDGTRKVYFMHFHDLGERDRKELAAHLRERNPKIRFLMSRRSLKRLFDEK